MGGERKTKGLKEKFCTDWARTAKDLYALKCKEIIRKDTQLYINRLCIIYVFRERDEMGDTYSENIRMTLT